MNNNTKSRFIANNRMASSHNLLHEKDADGNHVLRVADNSNDRSKRNTKGKVAASGLKG